MTNKEKLEAIRAEIERLMYAYNLEADISSAEDSIGEKVAAGKYDVCKHLLSLIDSTQEEPVSGDFEMALAEMIDNAQKHVVEPWVVAAQWKDELIKLAKDEEPISEDLEEVAKNHAVERYRTTRDRELAEKCKWSFKAGAKWQKKQMMKDVIDARVIDTKGNYPSLTYSHVDMMFTLEDMKVAEGDKVKLIIIKED